jgi:predicted patatin/cPLA2 family phospholipase
MYWEDLSGSRYLRLWRLPAYICAAYCNRFFGTTFSLRPIFDIEYLENVILSSKKVDYHTLFESHITVHIISHNLERDLNEYLTIASENDVRPMLRATGSGHPAYPRPEKVHGSLYIDGAARTDACEIEDILRRHPTEQVILVINEHGWREKSLRNILEKWATAILALPQYGWRQAWKIGCSGFTKVDRARIERTHPNVSIIENDLSISKWSTDAQQYKELYARGLALGAELIDKKWGPSSA